MTESYPILEFDPTPRALIEPSEVAKPPDLAERCVLCFQQDLLEKLAGTATSREMKPMRSTMGLHRVWELEWRGEKLVLLNPGLGAPLAVGLTEEAIARGCRKIIAFGSCGVLDRNLLRGQLVVPTSAVRDEGTSYHYAPPGREISPSPAAVAAIEAALRERSVPYTLGKTWTTDAFYRETLPRIARRKAEGCLTVEMEAAALFALAQFRNVVLGQILHCGDDASGERWDSRDGAPSDLARETALELAVECCLRM